MITRYVNGVVVKVFTQLEEPQHTTAVDEMIESWAKGRPWVTAGSGSLVIPEGGKFLTSYGVAPEWFAGQINKGLTQTLGGTFDALFLIGRAAHLGYYPTVCQVLFSEE